MRALAPLLVSLVAVTTVAWPATRLVLPDGTGDLPTIQAAVDASAPGDTVLLGDGTFTGDGNRDVGIGSREVTLISAGGMPGSCVLDCEGSPGEPHRAFSITAAAGAVTFEAFTIRNGYAAADGGGILCQGSALTIRNMAFRSNRASNKGGALFIFGSPDARLSESGFEQNEATFGGGAWIESSTAEIASTDFSTNVTHGEAGYGAGLVLWESTVRLDDLLFARNEGVYAAAVFCYASRTDLADCLFKENLALGACGGMYTFSGGNTAAYANLLRCEFVGNRANLAAGAMYISEWNATLEECVFRENFAASAAGVALGGFGDFLRCRFEGNSATRTAGAVQSEVSEVEFRECLFSANTAPDSGGALFAGSSSTFRLFDCTLNGNRSALGSSILCTMSSSIVGERVILSSGLLGAAIAWDGTGSASLSCSDVFGNEGGDWTGPIAGQLGMDGNFSADALFCDADGGDFTLQADSPCLPGNHPQGANCDVVGAFGEGCGGSTRTEGASWTAVKKMFR